MKKFLYVCLLSLLIQNFFLIPIKANEDNTTLNEGNTTLIEEKYDTNQDF